MIYYKSKLVCKESVLVKQAYINCLKKLREFRKNLKIDKDIKRGKLYFSWIKDKTEKISNEKDDNYIYKNIVNMHYTILK